MDQPRKNDKELVQELVAHGIPPAAAQHVTGWIAGAIRQGRPEDAWQTVSRDFLNPTQDFAVHTLLYEQCYGQSALLRNPGPAWFPSEENIHAANVTAAARQLGLPDYPSFYAWSIQHREQFWEMVIRRLNIRFRKPYEKIVDATDPTAPRWLSGARLNIAESCFQSDPSAPAIIEGDGASPRTTTTYGQLKNLAGQVAAALASHQIKPGDAVAIIGPLSSKTVAAYLGVILAGAAVVSIADSFAAHEMSARLRIANAKLIITQDVVPWGAKRLPLYARIAPAAGAIPIVVISTGGPEWLGIPLRPADALWQNFLPNAKSLAPFNPVERNPDDPINILFSSGTTGEPKAIPWDHTTPIKCAMDAHFHHDLRPDDVACWPTNLGWMMGPWLIFATLLNHATLALFQQAPTDRSFGEFVRDANVTLLGLVPSLLRTWRQTECMKGLDWSRIKAFSSSGECSSPPDMLYLMHLAGYRPIIEYCGGTEIGGAYITSTVVQPNIPSAFSTPALGVEMLLMNNNKESDAGEVFLRGASIGLSTRLLNRDHHAVYFKDAPIVAGVPLRRHGDELERLPAPYNNYFRVAGRSDDTMNLGGIKVGCAEIERAASTIPAILESAAIAVAPPGGGPSRLVIFAVLKPNAQATPDTLKADLQRAIREVLNPLFKLEEIRILPSLPRTASNKILRRQLRAAYSPGVARVSPAKQNR